MRFFVCFWAWIRRHLFVPTPFCHCALYRGKGMLFVPSIPKGYIQISQFSRLSMQYRKVPFYSMTNDVDPYSLNPDPDPAFQVNPDLIRIRIQGFDDQKLENTAEFFKISFLIKDAIYLSPGLHKGRPS
jgi:hypothetical protein